MIPVYLNGLAGLKSLQPYPPVVAMKKFFLLMVLLGLYQYHGAIQHLFRHPHAAASSASAGNRHILLFTFADCGEPCEGVRQELQDQGLDFKEYAVDKGEENLTLFRKYSAQNALPLTVLEERVVTGYSKSDIRAALASSYGPSMLSADERAYMDRHFYADGKPRVVLYGTGWCPYCKKLREDLRQDHIDFLDVDVEAAPDEGHLKDTLEIHGYPVTYVGYDRVSGYDYNSLKEKIRQATPRPAG